MMIIKLLNPGSNIRRFDSVFEYALDAELNLRMGSCWQAE
jgi:hypothetical protein